MADAGAERYSPQHVANFFLAKAEEDGRKLSLLKLIKLVYIAYGWTLATLDRKLFDEPIQAWAHGPVVPSVYHEFKHFERGPIDERAVKFDLDSFELTEPEIPSSDEDANQVLSLVWGGYKGFTGSALRNMTHQPDTPWSRVYEEGVRNLVIPDDIIKDHFQKKIKRFLHNAG